MHEFSICESIVATALQAIADLPTAPKEVTQVTISIGGLRQVVPDYLQFAFETLRQDTVLASAVLKINELPITLHCQACGHEQTIDAPKFTCSNCGSSQLKTINGMELSLDSIEVETENE